MTDVQKIRQWEHQLADCDNGSNADIPKKIDTLNDLAWALSDTDMQRAQTLSQTAHALATSNGNGAASYPLGVAYSLRTQGYLNLRLGDHPLGLSQLLKAQEIFESFNHFQGLPDIFDNIAGIYFQIGNFPEALSYMYKQLEVAQRLGDKRLIANAYNNLVNIYFETGDYDRAIEMLHQNLQIAAEIGYKRIESLSYLNLAETYLLAGDDKQALENALRALPVSQAAGFELFEVYALDFIGKSYLKLGDTAQATHYLAQALALSRKVESKVTESLILLNMGQAYREMQQFDLALEYLQQGVSTAQSINANSELSKGHLLLSEVFEQLGNFAQALHHFKQHHAFKELVFGEKADERLKVLQVAHDTQAAKKEAEIHRAHNEELKREIAARQRREERLRLLESVVEHITDGVLITEADLLDPPGPRIVYVNQAFTTITGYAKAEVIGQTPRLFQGPKTDRLALDQVRQALTKNRPVTVELINYTKAGQEFWIALSLSPVLDETGQTTHFVAIQQEITDRKRIEEALKVNQERYRLATQAGGVGVWDWNLRTGEFYLDPIIKAILGYNDEEIPNNIEVWANYIHPADSQAVMAAAQAHIEGQTPDYAYEHRMLHKDGSARWVFVHGKVINDEQGQAVRMVGTDTDITARKEVETQMQRQLEYVRALSACSQTLLAVSGSQADNKRLLGEALQYLVKPVQVSKIFLYENFDDPKLGFCSRLIVDVCAPGIPSAVDDPPSAVIPWSISPDENRRRLAAGEPVGGPTKTLFAATPLFQDYLLNEVHILSVQFFPIHFGEYWWGYVGFDDRSNEREWREEEILLLGTVSEILSSTLQRWQAEAREHRQRQIAESLQKVALILNRTLDQQQIVAAILNQLQGIVPYDGAALWLVDGEELVIIEAAGFSFRRVGWRLPLAQSSPQALVVRNRQPQIIADVSDHPEWPRWDEEALIRSWMGVPLLAGQGTIGLLSLVRSDRDTYSQEDLQVLQSFASQAVTAISNARLYQQVNIAHERLSILYQASQYISAASLVPQQIYAGIYAAVTQLMPADVFVVTLINETEQEAEDIYLIDQGQVQPGRHYPLAGTFAHYLLRRGASLRVDDYSALPQEEFSFELFGSGEDTRSSLAVLLRGRERVLGLLSVQSYELATYNSDELEMLELLAAHASIALENTQLYQQAQTVAALEERNRLARDLHDSVTQSLYSLTLLAEGWRRLAQRGLLTDVDSPLTELGEIAQQSLKEMRLLIYELRPPVLEQAGLLGALHQRLGAVERRAGIEARLIAEELINLPPQIEKGLYRITQEALNNALKHARATTVTVFVRASQEWLEIEIDDNGCGFEPNRLNDQPGLGLISMRERTEQLGGKLVIESKPGMGTTVKVKVSRNL